VKLEYVKILAFFHIKEVLISHLIHKANMKTSFRIEENRDVGRWGDQGGSKSSIDDTRDH
jgi:hypothetical protein